MQQRHWHWLHDTDAQIIVHSDDDQDNDGDEDRYDDEYNDEEDVSRQLLFIL